jgi:hypothetical protein
MRGRRRLGGPRAWCPWSVWCAIKWHWKEYQQSQLRAGCQHRHSRLIPRGTTSEPRPDLTGGCRPLQAEQCHRWRSALTGVENGADQQEGGSRTGTKIGLTSEWHRRRVTDCCGHSPAHIYEQELRGWQPTGWSGWAGRRQQVAPVRWPVDTTRPVGETPQSQQRTPAQIDAHAAME